MLNIEHASHHSTALKTKDFYLILQLQRHVIIQPWKTFSMTNALPQLHSAEPPTGREKSITSGPSTPAQSYASEERTYFPRKSRAEVAG